MGSSLDKALLISVLAGEIMLKNGGETYRVEETMEHIARACGVVGVAAFVIPTGVFLTLTDESGYSRTTMRRIKNRTINLDRIAKVNELSRRLVDKKIEYHSALAILEHIAKERTGFSLVPSMAAAGVVGSAYSILNNGNIMECGIAFLLACLVRYIAHIVSQMHGVRFTFEFLGSLAAAAIGVIVSYFFSYLNRDIIIVGAIMPLVPGIAITNGIRDIIAGDLLSGLSRCLEALLTAVAIAMGVVIVLSLVS